MQRHVTKGSGYRRKSAMTVDDSEHHMSGGLSAIEGLYLSVVGRR